MLVNFGAYLLPRMKAVSKRTETQLNEFGLTKHEFCTASNLLEICYFSSFCDTGVSVNVTARLCILCKYACTIFRNLDINTYRVHVNDNASNSDHSGLLYNL